MSNFMGNEIDIERIAEWLCGAGNTTRFLGVITHNPKPRKTSSAGAEGMTNVVVCGTDASVDLRLGFSNKYAGIVVAGEGFRRRIREDNSVIVSDQGEAYRHLPFIDASDPVYRGSNSSQRPSRRAAMKHAVFAGGGHRNTIFSQRITGAFRKLGRSFKGFFSFDQTLGLF